MKTSAKHFGLAVGP